MIRATFLLLLFPAIALAHPVTYEGGFMTEYDYSKERRDLHLHYSFETDKAIALHWAKISDHDTNFYTAPFNWRLKRWNAPASQGNIYLWAGPGLRETSGDEYFAADLGLQADWETRRIYTQFDSDLLETEGPLDQRMFRLRGGVAPYLANYDGLQTFIIAQTKYDPDGEAQWRAGPVLRFFYNNYLLEIGADQEGDITATGMIHIFLGDII